jgi:hypothetical protein
MAYWSNNMPLLPCLNEAPPRPPATLSGTCKTEQHNEVVSTFAGKTISFEALQNVFVSAFKIYIDAYELRTSRHMSAEVYKKRIQKIEPRIYKTGQRQKITECEIMAGIIVFNETNQPGVEYNTYTGEYVFPDGMPYQFVGPNAQNMYSIDNSIGYVITNSYYLPDCCPVYPFYTTGNPGDVILKVDLPEKLIEIQCGESVEFTIVNQGNHSLLLEDKTEYKVVGFGLIYDATSASFKLYKTSETEYYVYRTT